MVCDNCACLKLSKLVNFIKLTHDPAVVPTAERPGESQ